MMASNISLLPPSLHNLLVLIVLIALVVWAVLIASKLIRVYELQNALRLRRIVAIRGLGYNVSLVKHLAKHHMQALVHRRRTNPPQDVPRCKVPAIIKKIEVFSSTSDHSASHFESRGVDSEKMIGLRLFLDVAEPCTVQLLWNVNPAYLNLKLQTEDKNILSVGDYNSLAQFSSSTVLTGELNSGISSPEQASLHRRCTNKDELDHTRYVSMHAVDIDSMIQNGMQERSNGHQNLQSTQVSGHVHPILENIGNLSAENLRIASNLDDGLPQNTRVKLTRLVSGSMCGKATKLQHISTGDDQEIVTGLDEMYFKSSRLSLLNYCTNKGNFHLVVVIRPKRLPSEYPVVSSPPENPPLMINQYRPDDRRAGDFIHIMDNELLKRGKTYDHLNQIEVSCIAAVITFEPLKENPGDYIAIINKQTVAVQNSTTHEISVHSIGEVFGQDDENNMECVICLTESKSCILMPCRHLCVCVTCFRHIDKCPVCRAGFDSYLIIGGIDPSKAPLNSSEIH